MEKQRENDEIEQLTGAILAKTATIWHHPLNFHLWMHAMSKRNYEHLNVDFTRISHVCVPLSQREVFLEELGRFSLIVVGVHTRFRGTLPILRPVNGFLKKSSAAWS